MIQHKQYCVDWGYESLIVSIQEYVYVKEFLSFSWYITGTLKP